MKKSTLFGFLPGWGLAIAATAVYFVTLSRGVYPDESAGYLAFYTGLMPQLNPEHPLYALAAKALSLLPAGALSAVFNAFAALCSGAALLLLYRVMYRAVFLTMDSLRWTPSLRMWTACLAGAASVLAFGFSAAFWHVSNRAHVAGFDLLVLLAMAGLLLGFLETGNLRRGCVLAFFYGLASAEHSALYLFLPVFAYAVLVLLWRTERLSWRAAFGMILAGVAGLGCHAILAFVFRGMIDPVDGEALGHWAILWRMWQVQYIVLARSLPRVGWLLVVCFSVVPWLTMLMIGRRSLNEQRDWSDTFIHLVLTAAVVVASIGLFPRQIWSDRLVTPQLLVAMLYGYLVAYWLLSPPMWSDPERSAFLRKAGAGMRFVVVVPLLAIALWLPVRNWVAADARPAAAVNDYARRVVERMGNRTWLVSDGRLDIHILDAARKLGRPVKMLNMALGANGYYMAFIARQLDRVDLKNLASIGGDRLLTEWLASDQAATGTVSILSLPDYWIESGYAAMPRGVLYEGAKPGAAIDAQALWREHRALWEALAPSLDAAPPADPDAAEMLAYIRRHTARLANDLGVFFEDNGQKDLAIEAYRQTRRMDTNNVSALLNLAVLSRGGTVLPEAAAVERGLVALASDQHRLPLWRLAGTYGYVREPNAFAQSGWVWTFSGRRGLALANIKRAAALGAGPAATGLRQMMAAVYMAQEDAEKSRQLYEQVLQTETNNVPAMIGMARIAIRAGNIDGATNWLGRAQAAGAPYAVLALEKAAAHAQSGNVGEARAVLERLVERVPDATRAWALLAAIRLQQNDQLGFDDSIQRLRSMPDGELTAALLLAQRAFMEKNAETARREVATILRLQPNHRTALEMQLSLDVSQGKVEEAKQHARVLLQHHPDNAMGYYILGSVQFKEGKTELAESSLRRSLALRRTEATLNDLAWLLNQRGAGEEAEKLAREALTMAPGMGNAWDTLGMILLRRGDKPAAREAIEKAIALSPQVPEYQLHFAELLFAEGKFDAVRASLPALDKHWNAFTLEQQQRLTEIRQAAEKAAAPR